MIRLNSPIQPYAWGSRSVLAALQGRPVPSPGPEAELWLGAHPGGPSVVVGPAGPAGPVSLADLIAADPGAMLGAGVTARFGHRLPYLLKVLAAERPLSLQAHPDPAQAEAGFARECGGDGTSPRTYVDPYHKPELLVALDDFEALCGFRDPDAAADELAALGVAALAPVIAALRSGPVAQRLATAVAMLLDWPADDRVALVDAVARAGHPLTTRLAGDYPSDPGVVLALLLNHVRLQPGEAVFMPAGNLHAYLRGAGVEIMAASDNVLRGGMTPKHVDTAELKRVLRYEVLDDPIFPALDVAAGVTAWVPPVAEFVLVRAQSTAQAPVVLPGTGPRIVLGLSGVASLGAAQSGAAQSGAAQSGAAVLLGSGGDVPERGVALHGGEAVFVPAGDPRVVVCGDAVVFQASANI